MIVISRQIKRNLIINSLREGKTHLNGFRGATIKRLDFITPALVEYRADFVIHIGFNDITQNTVDQRDMKDSVNRIINVGKKCLYSGLKVIISSIFITKRFKHTRIDYNNYVVSHEKIIGKNSDVLRIPRVKNLNRLIMGDLNTNSISNKFDQLKLFALGSYSYFYRNQIGINVSYFPVYDRWL